MPLWEAVRLHSALLLGALCSFLAHKSAVGPYPVTVSAAHLAGSSPSQLEASALGAWESLPALLFLAVGNWQAIPRQPL